jgi:hypothetical protein
MAQVETITSVDEHTTWYFDTRATVHFTCNQSWLHHFTPIPPHPVVLGNNHIEHAVGHGTIVTNTSANNLTRRVVLERVLYVPSFGKNLILVHGMLQDRQHAVLEKNWCLILNSLS